jgi:hypothetical protein
MQDIEKEEFSRDANIDIALLVENKPPQDRDEYEPGYLDYMNKFIASNKFTKLPPDAQQRITDFLASVLEVATRTANLQTEAMNGATEQQGQDMGGVASMNPQDPNALPPQAPPAAPPAPQPGM